MVRLLFVDCWLLLFAVSCVRCLLFVVHRSLFAVCCLDVCCCLLFVVFRFLVLFVAHCGMFVVWRSFFVAC